jgi:hypothetical protein
MLAHVLEGELTFRYAGRSEVASSGATVSSPPAPPTPSPPAEAKAEPPEAADAVVRAVAQRRTRAYVPGVGGSMETLSAGVPKPGLDRVSGPEPRTGRGLASQAA